jgi:hypothetical protein
MAKIDWGFCPDEIKTFQNISHRGPENRDYGRGGIRLADYATPLYLQKLALNSPTSGGHSVGIVRSQTQATELEAQWLER